MNIDMAGEMGRQIKINRTGLYHFSIHKDIVVFNGRGLGGTSLINANVSIEASDDVFEVTEDWPKDFLDDMKHFKSKDLYHAKKMLKPKPTPDKFSLQKYDAVKKSGAALAKEGVKNSVYRTEINVNFEKAGLNHVGVFQNPCTLCGDCVSGCNYAAKNTLPMNYLPDAVAYGTEIYWYELLCFSDEPFRITDAHIPRFSVVRSK
jgi:cholesterol oxidase